MRILLRLIALVAVFLILRALLAPLVKAVAAAFRPSASSPPGSSPTPVEELKKDPVCGTFVAPEVAVTQKFNGQTIHFCSQKCRDEFTRRT